jgi:cytoskeletal protein CcmA (bactofilin family)
MFNTKKTSFETTSTSTINTIIGDKSKIIGTLTASEPTRVDGVLEGKILSESTVIIGEHGSITGDIEGHDILIAGIVNGNIHASERIRITSTGRVFGDIFTKTLVIDEGASFKGNCRTDVAAEMPAIEPLADNGQQWDDSDEESRWNTVETFQEETASVEMQDSKRSKRA